MGWRTGVEDAGDDGRGANTRRDGGVEGVRGRPLSTILHPPLRMEEDGMAMTLCLQSGDL